MVFWSGRQSLQVLLLLKIINLQRILILLQLAKPLTFSGSGATSTTVSNNQVTISSNRYRLLLYQRPHLLYEGGIELFSDTDQTVAANTVSATASRTYGIQLNSDGQAVVNVPWADTDTVYTLPEATSTVRGGIELFSNTRANSCSKCC